MCGIAGFLDARGTVGREHLAATGSAMAASLRHRGPDDSGVWVDPAAGISLAHRRLSILDLSSAGRQPMLSSCGRLVLTYNGEIYNYTELRLELAASGRTFRGQSDSEVLVEACAHWGVAETLKRINGMFAFAVWDRKTRTLYLARDRVGIKPLYWARFGGLFLFGSELKALRAHDGWVPQIDRESLRAYMRRGHVPAPFSIYRGVHKLHAGELLVYGSRDEPEISSYWDPAEIVAAAQARSSGCRRNGGRRWPRRPAARRCRSANGCRCAARRLPVRRHRFVIGRGSDAGAEQPSGEHVHDRVWREELRRGGAREVRGQSSRHQPHRTSDFACGRSRSRSRAAALVRRAAVQSLGDSDHAGQRAGAAPRHGGPFGRWWR